MFAAIETEIKFRVADTTELEAKLSSIGFHLITPRSFESNTLYDTPDRSLRIKRELLRIRQYNSRWLLTHKRIPDSGIGEDGHKHRIETETSSPTAQRSPMSSHQSDSSLSSTTKNGAPSGPTTTAATASSTKPRSESSPNSKAPPDWIDRIAHELGVAPEDRMTLSYGRLFEMWRSRPAAPRRT